MTIRTAALIPLALLALAAPAHAQDKSVVGRDTIIPGSGPGTSTTGGGGGLMLAGNAEDAAARRGLKPATVLGSKLIGMEVRDATGESVGKVEDLVIDGGGALKALVLDVSRPLGLGSRKIAVEPSALVLRPGGQAFAAVINLGKDTIQAAATFKPEDLLTAP